MKTKIKLLLLAALALLSSSMTAEATNVTLQGYAPYPTLGGTKTYYSGGAGQSGRYSNLGGGYYRTTTIRTNRINNASSYRSGSLSFELWAMPYYGASQGYVLHTRGYSGLNGYNYYYNVSSSGYARFYNTYRYPELNLFEYTTSGWAWRSDLSFSSYTLL
jgi:hypothetical protein